MGSPPRMRGKGSRQLHSSAAVRITPARAGTSQARKAAAAVRRDHPRVCGEKPFEFNNYAKFLGSPPRMRGKAPSRYAVFPQHGITPAYAGKRPPAARWNSLAEDHPRVCGEKCGYRLPFRSIVGSPPRVRGKDDGVIFKRHFERITPACAGKRRPLWSHPPHCQDHPRACGEKCRPGDTTNSIKGSPPRVRGKGFALNPACLFARITPARAGKSILGNFCTGLAQDHPRACGEKTKKIP